MSDVFDAWYRDPATGQWKIDLIDTAALRTAGPDTVTLTFEQAVQLQWDQENNPSLAHAARLALQRKFQVYSGNPLYKSPEAVEIPSLPGEKGKILLFKPKDP